MNNNINFKLPSNHRGLWNVLSKNEYQECLQPILELIDNSIAAKATSIYISIDFDKQTCSIEDDGIGFPNTEEGLVRCFMYSPENPSQTDLNEHGCGLKSSIAILDPADETWAITWKRDGSIFQVKAPYCKDVLIAKRIDAFPSGTHDFNSGTLIQFPIKRENFKALYSSKSVKCVDPIPKLKEELSMYWMYHERVESKQCQIFVNNEFVEPFSFQKNRDAIDTEIVDNKNQLNSGGKLYMAYYGLNRDIEKSWFKKTLSSQGAYIFKNGRLIVKITGGGSTYKRIMGRSQHNSLNGTIIIVNVTGPQSKLPVTVPTKNKFKESGNPAFDDMCERITLFVDSVSKKNDSDESEETLVQSYHRVRTQNFESADIPHQMYMRHVISSSNTQLKSTQLDIYEVVNNKHYVYEAKRDNKVSIQNIIQLYGNYILACNILTCEHGPNITVIPVLLINSDGSYRLPEDLNVKINALNSVCKHGFPVEIRNFKTVKLYPI